MKLYKMVMLAFVITRSVFGMIEPTVIKLREAFTFNVINNGIKKYLRQAKKNNSIVDENDIFKMIKENIDSLLEKKNFASYKNRPELIKKALIEVCVIDNYTFGFFGYTDPQEHGVAYIIDYLIHVYGKEILFGSDENAFLLLMNFIKAPTLEDFGNTDPILHIHRLFTEFPDMINNISLTSDNEGNVLTYAAQNPAPEALEFIFEMIKKRNDYSAQLLDKALGQTDAGQNIFDIIEDNKNFSDDVKKTLKDMLSNELSDLFTKKANDAVYQSGLAFASIF